MAWRTREDEAGLYTGHAHSTFDEHEDDNRAGVTTRRKCVVIFLSVALVAVLVAIIVPITINLQNRNKDSNSAGSVNSASNAATAACAASQYPATCMQSLQNINTTSALVFTEATLSSVRDGVDSVRLAVENISTPANAPAVQVCEDTLNVADEELTWIIGVLNGTDSSEGALNATSFQNMKVRLTAAMEMHTTCIDAFQESGTNVSASVEALMEHTNEIFSVALSFLSLLGGVGDNIYAWAAAAGYGGGRRRLLSDDFDQEVSEGEVPSWVEVQHRRHLLQTKPPGSYINVTVAANGKGNYRTITAALNKAPLNSKIPYVIHIMAGVYLEQVRVTKTMTNIMFIGDGIGKTIISVSYSVALTPNMTTFLSPALIVEGAGFLMKWITVRNTAGPQGHQAVALRVSADKTAFYQCAFDSFQDTLYAHTYRQYYRECQILGTIDYVFGNGYALFQKCIMIAKKSGILGQFNTYTAQGKTDVNQKSGLSFQNCTFAATADLTANQNTYPTYFGRPWKPYSTCVLLKCYIMGHVSPQGWVAWNASSFGLATSYFAEYQSNGPGATPAIIKQRVSWSKQITRVADANKWLYNYWADPVITANTQALFPAYVPATGFPFDTVL